MSPLSVSVIGSGNWGTSVAKLAATNALTSNHFRDEVVMWTYEERLADGSLLTERINNDHENVKYLPGVKLPSNLIAEPDLLKAAAGADLLILITPHQFVSGLCAQLAGRIKATARAVTFIKGILIEENRPLLISKLVEKQLGIVCDAVSGANVASEVAKDQFCETTLGCKDPLQAEIWSELFETPNFRVCIYPDVEGVQICGALKNVIAMAAGFCDGAGWGTNTKSAVMRQGFAELRLFAAIFCDDVIEGTFFESAGMADLITTCFAGRNVRVAAEFIRRANSSWEQLEFELLNGQKMQGQLTTLEVMEVLNHHHLASHFPLFTQAYKVAFEGAQVSTLLEAMRCKPSLKLPTHHLVRPLNALGQSLANSSL